MNFIFHVVCIRIDMNDLRNSQQLFGFLQDFNTGNDSFLSLYFSIPFSSSLFFPFLNSVSKFLLPLPPFILFFLFVLRLNALTASEILGIRTTDTSSRVTEIGESGVVDIGNGLSGRQAIAHCQKSTAALRSLGVTMYSWHCRRPRCRSLSGIVWIKLYWCRLPVTIL